MLPGFLLIFSAESGRILYVSNNVSDELGHPVVSSRPSLLAKLVVNKVVVQ